MPRGPIATAAAVVLLILSPAMAMAQTSLPVRAVEHPEYSRLVIPLPPGSDWRMTRDGTDVRILIEGAAIPLDLSGVFERMPRTRILAVETRPTPSGQVVDLNLGCSCLAKMSLIGTGYLAVDIRRAPVGGTAAEGARFLRPDAPGNDRVPGARGERTNASPPVPAEAEDGNASGRDPAEPARGTTDAVLEARSELMRQLARAAEEGLLTIAPRVAADLKVPDAPAPGRADPGTLPAAGVPPGRPARPAAVPAIDPALREHLVPEIHIRDGAEPRRRAAADSDAQRPPCANDRSLDPAAWQTANAGFAGALGPLRAQLVAASGEIDPEAVANLARHYIASGFGREAESLVSTLGAGIEEGPLLRDLGRVLEGRAPAPEGPILRADDCTGRIMLWRAAAGLEPFGTGQPSDTDVRIALEELPPILRRLLGHAVAEHALRAAGPEAAREILDLLDRTPRAHVSASETAIRAELALAEGAPERALALTTPALAKGQPDPKILLVHSAAALAAGAPLTDRLVNALDAGTALIPGGRAEGLDLRFARIRVEAARGRPAEALAALRALKRDLPAIGGRAEALGAEILAAIPKEDRTQAEAVRAILEHRDALGPGEQAQDLRREYAAALEAGGLPNAALELLAGGGALASADTRLTAARAHLALGDAARALSVLDGMYSATARQLKARAHLARGNVKAGVAAFPEGEIVTPYAQKLALLAGATERFDPALAGKGLAVIAAREGARHAPANRSSTLASARAALQQAIELRGALPDLLARPPLP